MIFLEINFDFVVKISAGSLHFAKKKIWIKKQFGLNNWLKKNYRGLLGAQKKKKKTELISDLQMITFSKYYCFVKYENVGRYIFYTGFTK